MAGERYPLAITSDFSHNTGKIATENADESNHNPLQEGHVPSSCPIHLLSRLRTYVACLWAEASVPVGKRG